MIGVKPFTPLRDCFPQTLVDAIAATPPEAVCYVLMEPQEESEPPWLAFLIKTSYAEVQPIVDADDVVAEFELEVDDSEEEDAGCVLVSELEPEEQDPPFTCSVRTAFSWADPLTRACFVTLLDQDLWPFIFITQDSASLLAYREYENPVAQADRENLLWMVTHRYLQDLDE